MADAVPLVDYYAVLNLPTGANIDGIENAYARLSGELAMLGEVDEASSEALRTLNGAYAILARADLRRQYDEVFLAARREAAAKQFARQRRRRQRMQDAIIGALVIIVLSQAAALLYLGWDHVSTVVGNVLSPGGAG